MILRLAALVLVASVVSAPVAADPGPQLTNSVATRLAVYGLRVDPGQMTTAQAAALHMMLVSERGYINVRRRAEAILRDPDFRD